MNSYPHWLKIILPIVVIAQLAGGIGLYCTEKSRLRRDAEMNLSAIAHLKANQISNWRTDQLREGNELIANFSFVKNMTQLLADPQTPANASEEALICFRAIQEHYHFRDIQLVDSKGRVYLCINGRNDPIESESEIAGASAASSLDHQSKLLDLHADNFCPEPHLTLFVPIFAHNEAKLIGAVLCLIDPLRDLYPLIQSWPTPSKTAETLLIRREDEEVLFLNNLRHQPNAALKLRLPLSRIHDQIFGYETLGKQKEEQKKAKKDLQRLAHSSEIFRKCLLEINACLDLDSALACLVEKAIELSGIDCGCAYVIEGQDAVLQCQVGMEPEFIEQVAHRPLSTNYMEVALAQPQEILNVLERFPDRRELGNIFGVQHLYSIGLVTGKCPFAFLKGTPENLS